MKKLVLLLAIISMNTHSAMAASATAKAKQIVIAALNITKVSDLEFGEAPQGDVAKTVAAGTSENTENASFLISGEPGKSISVTVPLDGVVKMVTGSAGPDEQISVNNFSANLTSTSIGANGNTDLFVGATRDALSATQVAGSYEGDFTVTVVY